MSLSLLRRCLFLLSFLSAGVTADAQFPPHQGRLEAPDLKESSGLVASRRYRDVFWTHNDDGAPLLFAVNSKGRLIRSYLLEGATNHDWESIAVDDDGRLYILDNTSRLREDLKSEIIILDEPNPHHDGIVSHVRSIEMRTDRALDLEAMFSWAGKLYIVSKPWDGQKPRAYRIEDLQNGGEATFLGELNLPAMITGADLNQSGDLLAFCSYRALFIFQGARSPEKLLQLIPLTCRLNAGQVEGITWAGDTLFLTNEQRDVYRVPSKKWKKAFAPASRTPRVGVPRTAVLPSAPTEEWPTGQWLWAQDGPEPKRIGRVVWGPEGLCVGVRLPDGLTLPSLSADKPHNFAEWFTPGLIYLMLNPDGTRPLVYGTDDRGTVLGELPSDGGAGAQARELAPATLVTSIENSPPWLDVRRAGGEFLVIFGPATPGLGRLKSGRRLGFNLVYVGDKTQLVSWTPLTVRFPWDSPSFWGLLELR